MSKGKRSAVIDWEKEPHKGYFCSKLDHGRQYPVVYINKENIKLSTRYCRLCRKINRRTRARKVARAMELLAAQEEEEGLT